MVKVFHNETIAAIATPMGEGAIAIIRLSGPNAITAVDAIYRGRSKLSDAKGFTAHHGKLVESSGDHIDDVVVTVFRKPHSYTGEDSVEISCHGGLYNSHKVLAAVLSTGVRQAEPGEFTKRAFLNGKMDLSQAEAVSDLIASRSAAAHQASINQLEGRFSLKIKELRDDLTDLGSLLELQLDFSEEGVELLSKTRVLERISLLRTKIEVMMNTYQVGKLYREGVSVVIVGKPNAGKSSLFNALLKENRAIVTEIPGTTRDSLDENISLDGVLFRLSDTAGLRETSDPVELEGVVRAKKLGKDADILLLVVDASLDLDRQEVISFLNTIEAPRNVVIAYNKIDLLVNSLFQPQRFEVNRTLISEIYLSALTNAGLDVLRKTLLGVVAGSNAETSAIQVTNRRHFVSLQSSGDSLSRAYKAAETGFSGEFVALDVKAAADSLSEIVGEISTDDMLNNIFSHFCIGK